MKVKMPQDTMERQNQVMNDNIIDKYGRPVKPAATFTNAAFTNDEHGAETIFRRKSGNANGLQLAESGNAKDASAPNPPPMDFDDILPLIGEFGKYQKILFLLMIPFATFVAFVYFSQIFMTLVPEQHWCHVPELEELTVEERLALSIPRMSGIREYDNCKMYDVNYTEVLAKGMRKADPSWPVVACRQGWSYNFTDYPYPTVATEQNWVCEHDALPTYAQSIFFLGAIVGGLLFGWIADKFGRIPALVGCNLIGFAAGVGTSFTRNFWQFALMRFFVGFAFDNCFTMMYILVLEYVGPRYRTFVANMSIALFFTAAACILPWIAYFIADWKLFAIVTSAPLILVVLTPFVIPESARWLVSQGKVDKAVSILKRLEKVNGKHVPTETYQTFSASCLKLKQEENKNSSYSILDLFKTPRLRRTTLLLIVIWMAISLVFDGHVRNVSSLGVNVFFTFTVACFTEFPADSILTIILDKWGRRWLACGSMVASGIFSLFATLVPTGIYFASFAIMGRFFVNISYNIGLQYAAEILPTVVRAQGVAFIHIMGYVASIIAPFVVYLEKVSPVLPLVILGVLGIIGGLLALLLPETLNHDLPQTLTDGEEFGRGQSIWDFPCLTKKVDEPRNLEERQQNFVRSTQTGASLRSSTRGELRSSILRRSVNSRYSSKL
ncbi:organic cation transporter protein [Bactrocera dorsalis]|uniref:Organic cation transporter protein n=4 Tax=Bactrocera dorsalis TaxID=27457 RepID=A0A6I9VF68_BACDO|nr:organic cation transporter protein [Bactrocera dorsalis]